MSTKPRAARKPSVKLDAVLGLVNSSIDGWRILERDAGLDASVSVMTVIDELERLKERICLLSKQLPRS